MPAPAPACVSSGAGGVLSATSTATPGPADTQKSSMAAALDAGLFERLGARVLP